MSSGDTSASSVPSPAAGWYPDPLDPILERLWDGEQWSEQTRPAGSGAAPSKAPTLPLRRPSAADTSAAASTRARERSGRGWSTGSIVGIGCGLLALLSVGGCVVLVGVVPLMAVRGEEVIFEQADEVAVAIPETTMFLGPEPMEPMEEFPPTTAPPGLAVFGSSAEMVAVLDPGAAAAFEVTVEEPVDVTDPVSADGGLDGELAEGDVLVGIPATVLLRESLDDPLRASGLFDWTIVGGATATAHQPVDPDSVGCELIDDELDAAEEFGVGEERRGIVCFVIPSEDFEHPETQVVLEVVGGAPITWIR